LAFVYQIIIANIFGVGSDLDVFFASNTYNIIIVTMATNSINFAVTPILVMYYKRGNIFKLRNMANSIFNIVLFLFLILAFIQYVFSTQIVNIFFPGFSDEQFQLTVQLYRAQAFLSVITVLSGILIALHYTFKNLYRTVIIPAIGQLFGIILIIFMYKEWGIYSLLFGLILGQITNFSLLSLPFIKYYKFSVKLNNELVETIKKIYPLLISGIFSKSNVAFDRFFASSLGAGSITLLQYGHSIINIISGLINKGISIVTLRKFSLIRDEKDKFNKQFVFTYQSLVFIIIPVSFLIIYFLRDGLQIIVISNRINLNDIRNIYLVVCAFIGFFIGGSLSSVIVNTFYSKGLTNLIAKTTIVLQIIGIGIKIGLFMLIGFWGLPIAFSLTSLLNTVVLLLLYNRNIYKINLSEITLYLIRIISISLIAIIIPLKIHANFNHSFISACLNSLFFLIMYFIISMILEKNISTYIFTKLKRYLAI
jgi:putative peptidoglycan lipid II flippase